MTGEEIRERIISNNERIESLLDASKFVLNKEVNQLIMDNRNLQNQCKHVYENGYCIYCFLTEKKENN